MADAGDAAHAFTLLARALRDAGATGLRKELYQAIDDAVRPVGKQVADLEHLKPYMPDRYAEILAYDLAIQVSKRTGTDAGVTLRMKGKAKKRHVTRLNKGILTHPVFGKQADEDRAIKAGKGHGRGWKWVEQKIHPAFFDDKVNENGPAVRAEIEKALRRVTAQIETSVRR